MPLIGMSDAAVSRQMLNKVKAEWQDLKRSPAGERFVQCYERHQARDAPWLKPLLYFAAVFSLVIGVVLVFIPGPAILFFAISAALMAAESHAVATSFDKVELFVRRLFDRVRTTRRRRQARAETRVGRLDKREAAKLEALAAAAFGQSSASAAQMPQAAAQPDRADMHAAHEVAALEQAGPIDMSKLQLPEVPAQTGVIQAQPHAAPIDMSKLHVPDAPVQPHAAPIDMSKLHVPDAPAQPHAAPIDMSKLHVPAEPQTEIHADGEPGAARGDAWKPSAPPPLVDDDSGAPQSLHAAATRHVRIDRSTDKREILQQNAAFTGARPPLAEQAPPIAASTRQGHAPIELLVDAAPAPIPLLPIAGTMKIWTSDAEQAVAFQNAQPKVERPSSQPPAVVMLAPPAIIIGVQKRTRPSGPNDRRATPPPRPRKLDHSRA
jgi:hypothetical protein